MMKFKWECLDIKAYIVIRIGEKEIIYNASWFFFTDYLNS